MTNSDIRNQRFAEMNTTADLMVKEVECLKKILQEHIIFQDGELEKDCLDFLENKIGKEKDEGDNETKDKKERNKPLRAYFFRKMYEYLREYREAQSGFAKFPNAEALFTQKLPFVFEVVITIQYLHNQILDEKYDVKQFNHPQICQNLISSNILREFLFIYIKREIVPMLPNDSILKRIYMFVRILFGGEMLDQKNIKFRKISTAVRNLFLLVDLGQHTDKRYNHYKRWKHGLPKMAENVTVFDDVAQEAIADTIKKVQEANPGREDFILAYFKRVYLSNVYFFRCMTELIFDLVGCSNSRQFKNMQRFSIQYGYMLQIINDYADFSYINDKKEREDFARTSAKSSDDFFSDLYNFNITLPLIYHLKEGNKRNIEAYLEGGRRQRKILTLYPEQIMQEIKKSGAIRASFRLSRILADLACDCLDPNNTASPYFKDMCAVAKFNKFYKIFK